MANELRPDYVTVMEDGSQLDVPKQFVASWVSRELIYQCGDDGFYHFTAEMLGQVLTVDAAFKFLENEIELNNQNSGV